MEKKVAHDLRAIARQFQICGGFQQAEPYGTGHINDTYCVSFNQAGAPARYARDYAILGASRTLHPKLLALAK